MLLRKRAEDLVSMADKIAEEFHGLDEVLGGDIYLGLAESYQIRRLAAVIRSLRALYPNLRYHITSGDTEQVTEKLDRGVIDFAVLAQEPDTAKYHALPLPEPDVWGLVVPAGHPLASRDAVTFDDLVGLPLFCSEQGWDDDIARWCGEGRDRLRLEGSFRLSYNGSLFVREGLGCLLTFDHLVDTGPGSGLVFLPLAPQDDADMRLAAAVFESVVDEVVYQPRNQALVGGEIECISLPLETVLCCNATGKWMGLPANRKSRNDTIHGTFFLYGDTPEGYGVSLAEKQIAYFRHYFTEPQPSAVTFEVQSAKDMEEFLRLMFGGRKGGGSK